MWSRRRWIVASITLPLSGWLSAASAAEPPVTAVYVKDMHCEGCAKKLRAKLYKLPGVLRVTTNVKQGVAIITPGGQQTVSLKALWEAAESAKFQVVKVTSAAGSFNQKPSK